MAVRSRDELIEAVRAYAGEDNSDAVIALLEDISDTVDDYDRKVNTTTDWESKYNENDKMWRDKYMARFSGEYGQKDNSDVDTVVADSGEGVYLDGQKPITYDDLFVGEGS